ncbi:unnamed protein product [Rotaria sordida]|uniref:Uncharacterized protein n=1 Tax=Rotaria sordida TaxID=392033 RepID=A0A814LGL8_9BILA|nr:unnamed protein product [Rotaria sordida]CAF3881199.1 unnamed protein product [Rotaria sordida]
MYEIFEFLDYFHVYEAFFNINIRFRNLLTISTLPIEINISSMSKLAYQRYYKDIIMTNTNQINSLRLSNVFIYDLISSSIEILSEFLQLKRRILDNIESKYLEKLLVQLISLPFLSSLIISSVDNIKNKNVIYHQIFRLPSLKYCKLSLEGYSHNDDPLSLVTNDHSSIEHLIINNCIYLDELNSLVSYVPQLRQKYCMQQAKIHPPGSSYLTYVSLELDDINFDQFEHLVIDLFATIQVLRILIKYNTDIAYVNNNRWEKLILSHMPNLRIFDIRHENWPSNITVNNNSNYNPLTLDN